jgi:hypothetical protein
MGSPPARGRMAHRGRPGGSPPVWPRFPQGKRGNGHSSVFSLRSELVGARWGPRITGLASTGGTAQRDATGSAMPERMEQAGCPQRASGPGRTPRLWRRSGETPRGGSASRAGGGFQRRRGDRRDAAPRLDRGGETDAGTMRLLPRPRGSDRWAPSGWTWDGGADEGQDGSRKEGERGQDKDGAHTATFPLRYQPFRRHTADFCVPDAAKDQHEQEVTRHTHAVAREAGHAPSCRREAPGKHRGPADCLTQTAPAMGI